MLTTETYSIPATEHLMTEREAAAYLKWSVRTLQRTRMTGEGPIYRRLGKRRIAYLRSDLVSYVASRAFNSTSCEGYRRTRKAASANEMNANTQLGRSR